MFSKLFLVFAAVVQLSLAETEVPGTLVNSPYSIVGFATFPTDCTSGYYTICDSCSSYMVCMGGTKTETVKCSGDKPFCSSNACVATNDDENCPVNPLTCTSAGFFPDPRSCVFYHYCENAGLSSSVYQCPTDYVYNADTHLCKLKKVASDCVAVNCDSTTKTFKWYGTSKTYYAYCLTTGEIYMLKCGDYSAFDGDSCVFTCPKAGYFTHSDSAKYYDCYLSGSKLVYVVRDCTTGKVFNYDKQVCLTP